MKIQNISNYIKYNCSIKSVKNEETAKTKKYDVIDIKSRTDENNGGNIASVKRKIVEEVDGKTKADKLKKIKNSIDNKNYRIDAEEIAGKILK
jgi:anti-sigma28 factor (negative regulator of flagellin synthesis)